MVGLPLLRWFMDLFFPPKCTFCGKIVRSGERICEDCVEDLPWTAVTGDENWILGEGMPCLAPLWYRGHVSDAVVRLKFCGAKYYGRCFGELMADIVPEGECYDVVSWVPLSKKRRRKRGYNQAELIARVVADGLDVEAYGTLYKWKNNEAQTSLEDDHQRGKNVEDAYEMLDVSVKNLHILLVDDVITTGATFSECRKILLEAGAAQVTCLGLARARR